jgi:hypothetical protein
MEPVRLPKLCTVSSSHGKHQPRRSPRIHDLDYCRPLVGYIFIAQGYKCLIAICLKISEYHLGSRGRSAGPTYYSNKAVDETQVPRILLFRPVDNWRGMFGTKEVHYINPIILVSNILIARSDCIYAILYITRRRTLSGSTMWANSCV